MREIEIEKNKYLVSNQNFNDLPWHDAELKDIIIDRSQDIVKILVHWPESYGDNCAYIEFLNCYALKADMNFGIVPPDWILDAECIEESKELEDIKKTWAKMGIEIPGLRCYKLNTNSTNSDIKFFALDFHVINA